jgi:hypothetical protein
VKIYPFVAFALAAAVALGGSSTVDAKGGRTPEDVFAGKVLTSAKRFPASARSASGYVSQLKKQSTTKFREDKVKQSWKIHYAAFFRRPYNDLELTIKLWDMSSGRKRMVSSFEQYLDRRGERVIISHMTLERHHFGVNKKIKMTVEDHRGQVYAEGNFEILGQAERYSGQVSFTEEETKEPTP